MTGKQYRELVEDLEAEWRAIQAGMISEMQRMRWMGAGLVLAGLAGLAWWILQRP